MLSILLLPTVLVSTPAHTQSEPDSTQSSLKILVEGDPSAVRAIVESFRRTNVRTDPPLELVTPESGQHDIRLISSIGTDSVWVQPFNTHIHSNPHAQAHANSPSVEWFTVVSVVGVTRDGKFIFTVTEADKAASTAVVSATTRAVARLRAYVQTQQTGPVQASDPIAPAQRPSAASDEVSGLPPAPGVYYKGESGWLQLREAIQSGTSHKGIGLSLMTWGGSPVKLARRYDGPRALAQTTEGSPAFYVRGFSLSESDVTIVQLNAKKGYREVEIASVSPYRSRSGYRNSDSTRVVVNRVAGDVYRISPVAALQPGEYLLSLFPLEVEGAYEFGISVKTK
jgi:hypothetical protein